MSRAEDWFHYAPAALVVTDLNGVVVEANKQAQALLAPEGAPVKAGRGLVPFVAGGSRMEFQRLLGAIAADGAPLDVRLWMCPRDGEPFPARLRAIAFGEPPEIVWAIEDVAAQEELQQRLEATAGKERSIAEGLRTLNDSKNAFMLAVSHDLRTPLAAVGGLAEVLLNRHDRISEADRAAALQRIQATANQVMSLLGDLLDTQRIDMGALEARRQPVDIVALIRQQVEEVIAGRRSVELLLEPATAFADAVLTSRLVGNLLKNAVDHTADDTTVWVRSRVEPDGVLIVVEDNGPGITDEEKRLAFEPFHQGDARRPGGLGVGLALVRQLAELQGGHAWVEDREGGGASFQVVLPLHHPE